MFRPILLAMLVLASSSAHAFSCNAGQSEMSVEGVEGVFCVDASPICIADISNGACPMVSAALPGGSYCGLVATGVYGCKTGSAPPPTMVPMELPTEAPTEAPTQAPTQAPTTQAPMTDAPTTTPVPVFAPTPSPTDGSQCMDGDYEMSVEGVPGIFCLSQGPICMAEISTGTCPGPQNGLPNGSYCGRVASGVFGCKVNVDGGATQAPAPVPAAMTAVPATTTVAPIPTAAPTPVPTAAPTPVPSWTPVPTVVAPSPAGSCGVNGSAMSVEGVVSVFCVNEPACVADRSTGNCPGAQPGLEFGSYCEKLTRTGAYGCKPYSSPNTPNSVVYPSVLNCAGNAKGDTPVSIVGAGTFCARQPVCAGTVKGNCPQAQDGLGSDSFCAMIATGVMGCVMAA